MNNDIIINALNLSKIYKIYNKPIDRLKEAFSLSGKKRHKDFYALDGINLSIKRGSTVGILGSNGAGKSTLLKILSGVVTPSSGSVKVNGRVASLLELGAGFDPEMNGYENIYLNGSIMGFSRKDMNEKVDEIVSFADIGDFINQPMKVYSSGMFVRLAFATQIAVNPDILIIDEALAVGDAYFVHKCMRHFHKIKENGTTIILVTHDMTAVRTLCDDAIWLLNGKIQHSGEAALVADKYLEFVTNMKVAASANQKVSEEGSNVDQQGCHETVIPNIEERFGDQGCSIVGLGLYNENMTRVSTIKNGETIIFRLSFVNNCIDEDQRIIIGYKLRNQKGVDIASTNSEIENSCITPSSIGNMKTVQIVIDWPFLHPGSYSLSVSVAYRRQDGKMNGLDSIKNIMVFNVESEKLIHVLMSLNTRFVAEE